MVFYFKQSHGRGKRIHPEGDGDDEFGDDPSYSIDLSDRWSGVRVHPTSSGLPRDAEESLPDELKEMLRDEEMSLGESEGDEPTSSGLLQEGWAILGEWDSDASWQTDGSGSDQEFN